MHDVDNEGKKTEKCAYYATQYNWQTKDKCYTMQMEFNATIATNTSSSSSSKYLF